jgi:tight adherence protein B
VSGAATAVLAAASMAFAAVAVRVADRSAVRSAVVAAGGRATGAARRLAVRRLGIALTAVASLPAGFAIAGPAGAVAGAATVAVAPTVRRRRRRAADAAALQDGLAEAVATISAAIRAGRSMAGALEEAASAVAPPLGPRLATLVDRVALGTPVDRAVLEIATSVPGSEGRLVAAVLGLHQRSGGDAPAVLDRVARTLRERRASAREVRSLTAQARLSGAILGFLPIGFFLFLSLTARADVERAVSSTTGRTAIVVGLAMQATAFAWIRHLLRVDA